MLNMSLSILIIRVENTVDHETINIVKPINFPATEIRAELFGV